MIPPYAFRVRAAAAHGGGLSESVLRRAIRRGELPALRIGSGRHPVVLVRRVDLERWLDSHIERPAATVPAERDSRGRFEAAE